VSEASSGQGRPFEGPVVSPTHGDQQMQDGQAREDGHEHTTKTEEPDRLGGGHLTSLPARPRASDALNLEANRCETGDGFATRTPKVEWIRGVTRG